MNLLMPSESNDSAINGNAQSGMQKCLTSIPEPTKWLLNGAEIEEDPIPYVIRRPFPAKSYNYEEIELLRKNDFESLIYHANETEGKLHQLHKQHDGLVARYDEAKRENLSVRLEMEQYKQETLTLRKQLNRLTGEQTERQQNLKEWMYRTEKCEETLIDLRRMKEKLSRQNTDFEQQMGQLHAQLDKKQKHSQIMLDEFIQTQLQLDISEKENIDLKSSLSRNEQRVKDLSQELLITKDRLEKTQLLLGEAELVQSAAEQKTKKQNAECNIRIEQYQIELEKVTNQLMEERERSDLLLVQLEGACHRSSAYASQVEELRSQLESMLRASTNHVETSQRTNDQIEKLNFKITELENLVSVLNADKLKLTQTVANRECLRISLTRLISDLKNEIQTKETDLSATKFQQNVVNDQIIQLENDKRLLVADRAKAIQQMQIKYFRVMNLLRRRTRSVLSNTGRHHQCLHRRLAHMKRTQQQLIRRLAIRTGQLQRLDQLLWETGWKYTRIKDQLERLVASKTDERTRRMDLKSSGSETMKADVFVGQLVNANQKNPTAYKEL